MNAPFQGFPPELLAKLAQASFRPPQQMMGMQAPGMQMPQQPGMQMGLGDGMAGLGVGLGAWKPNGVGPTPNGDPNDNRPLLGAGGVDPRLIDPLTGQPRRGLVGPV